MKPDTPNYTDPSELLAVVDTDDNPIGAERRDIIHRDGLLHRAIHVFLFRPTGELLLQQRSPQKDRFPLHWECLGGHVAPGDTYDETAYREATEELGIILAPGGLQPICKVPASAATDQEFIMVYKASTIADPAPNPHEVIAHQWQSISSWQHEMKTSERLFSPVLQHTIQVAGILK